MKGQVLRADIMSNLLLDDESFGGTVVVQVAAVLRGHLLRQTPEIEMTYGSSKSPGEIGGRCMVIGATPAVRDDWGRRDLDIDWLLPCPEANSVDFSALSQVPLHWSANDGNLLSPWATASEPVGGRMLPAASGLSCSRTGWPAWLTGAGVLLRAKPVREKRLPGGAPHGDGLLEVVVANPTRRRVEVPALPQVDGRPLWAQSLLLRAEGKVFPLGKRGTPNRNLVPVSLAPGESQTTVIDALPSLRRGLPPGHRSWLALDVILGDLADRVDFIFDETDHGSAGTDDGGEG